LLITPDCVLIDSRLNKQYTERKQHGTD
jgi:hypothetical protein